MLVYYHNVSITNVCLAVSVTLKEKGNEHCVKAIWCSLLSQYNKVIEMTKGSVYSIE